MSSQFDSYRQSILNRIMEIQTWKLQRAEQWYETPIPALGGTPRACVERNQHELVYAFLKRVEEDSELTYWDIKRIKQRNEERSKKWITMRRKRRREEGLPPEYVPVGEDE